MKIYTEVNYELKNGILEQVSSESFDYSGPILQCGGGGSPVKAVKKVVKKVVDTTSETASDIGSGVTTTLQDAGSTINTNIQGAAEGLGTAVETTKSNVGGLAEDFKGGVKYYKEELAKKMGASELLEGIKGAASEELGGGGSTARDAPGASESIGAGGQGGMKGASMGAVKKTTAGAGGKRRLRKVSRSGAKV